MTSTGRQPPAAPSATNSVILGVEMKSPGAARQKRCPMAMSKYSLCGSLRAAAAMSGSSALKSTCLWLLQ